jgi:PAS domain S-box-containing protein
MSVKILLVAIKAEERLALEELLCGYDIICAVSEREALSLLDGRPDVGLVIAELNKADKAGLRLLEIFKAGSRYAGLRLIALTEPGEPDMEISALKAGAADCVRKPLLAEALRNRVDTQLQLISLLNELARGEEIEKALSESERSKAVLLSNLPGMAYRCSYDKEWTMQFISEGCRELTGYQPDELLYNNKLSFNDIIAPEYRESLWDKWRDIVREKRKFKEEYEIITADGTRKWVLEIGQVIFGKAAGEVEALEGIIIDISDLKEKELKLRHISEVDRLTGLYNRLHFEGILKKAEAGKPGGKRALVLISLKRLNSLKVIYGYKFSEGVINRVASKLAELSGEHRLL